MLSWPLNLTSAVCELRLLELHDSQAFYQLVCDDKAQAQRWLPWIEHFKNDQDAREFIATSLTQYVNQQGIKLGIWCNQSLCGGVSVQEFDWPNSTAVVGVWLKTDYQGQGIATAALGAMCHYLFKELKLNRIEARSAADNQKSIAITQRLGFKTEGTLRQTQYRNGQYVDEVVSAILASQWCTPPEIPA